MSQEKRLRQIFSRLPPGEQESLLAFAEFLLARAEPAAPPARQEIPRPEKESVIAAVKRLSASYPMLEKSSLFHETSALVSQHVLQGRAAAEVIDELESLFTRHYESLGQEK